MDARRVRAARRPLGLGRSAEGVHKVTLQLRWDHQFQFAGYYAALWPAWAGTSSPCSCPRSAMPTTALAVADKLLAAIREPATLERSSVKVSGSIGIAVFPDAASSGDELLKHADIALYWAKALGRNWVCLFVGLLQEGGGPGRE